MVARVSTGAALALVAMSALAVSVAHGQLVGGPLPYTACFVINPDPVITSCSAYPPPTTNLLTTLPYDVEPYQTCVRERCVCTGTAASINFDPTTIYCNASGWMESGFTTCNAMGECFKDFWECAANALEERVTSGVLLTSAEIAAWSDITTHGSTPGQPFQETETFLSCRQVMCDAAASRANCGLLTCLPNFTQCYEFIKPPPLPYYHQLCTQGCRASLVMMAMTAAVVSMSFCCCFCCPATAKELEPFITNADDDDKDAQRSARSLPSSHGNTPKADAV